MALSTQLRERLTALATEFQQELRPPEGAEGCYFAAVEELAVELGDLLAREVMEQQSPCMPTTTVCRCPKCDRVGRLKKTRRKSIQTRRGPITLPEPEYYCAGCRRSFFPSVQGVGHRA